MSYLWGFSIKPRAQRWSTTHNLTLIPWTLLLPLLPPRDWRLSEGGKSGQMKYWGEVSSADYIPAYEQVLRRELKDSVQAAVDGIKSDCYLFFTCGWSGCGSLQNTQPGETASLLKRFSSDLDHHIQAVFLWQVGGWVRYKSNSDVGKAQF